MDGEWTTGALSTLNIAAAPNTSIAAFQYEDDEGVHIRIYLQGERHSSPLDATFSNPVHSILQRQAHLRSKSTATMALGSAARPFPPL